MSEVYVAKYQPLFISHWIFFGGGGHILQIEWNILLAAVLPFHNYLFIINHLSTYWIFNVLEIFVPVLWENILRAYDMKYIFKILN